MKYSLLTSSFLHHLSFIAPLSVTARAKIVWDSGCPMASYSQTVTDEGLTITFRKFSAVLGPSKEAAEANCHLGFRLDNISSNGIKGINIHGAALIANDGIIATLNGKAEINNVVVWFILPLFILVVSVNPY
jgi:hypothetical protein